MRVEWTASLIGGVAYPLNAIMPFVGADASTAAAIVVVALFSLARQH